MPTVEESKIEYDEEGEVLSIKQLTLDPEKLINAPPMYRVKEKRDEYVISGDLLKAFKNEGFTNIITSRLEQSSSPTGI